MTLHDLIFSNKQPERFLRHALYWIAQSIFWIFWVSFFFYRTWDWIVWGFQRHGFFILEISYTYLITYYLIPKFLYTTKYSKFVWFVSLLTLITYFLFVSSQFIIHGATKLSRDEQLLQIWFSTMHFIVNGPPIFCGMFLTVKMLKNYYLKMQDKASIIKETANAELQLLKAQIHPHFLFNTLNNIYSFNLNKSPLAADLVLKLSHTLKYMVNDCDAKLVPLEKEIKMLTDYIGLEQVRYGKRLKLEVNIDGDSENKLVAPLLLIPFVENSFKHGSSKMLEHPWIKLQVSSVGKILHFEISNSKPQNPEILNVHGGIGLKSVRKRLELLYPNDQDLEITSGDHSYHVKLKLPLHVEEAGATQSIQSTVPVITRNYATE